MSSHYTPGFSDVSGSGAAGLDGDAEDAMWRIDRHGRTRRQVLEIRQSWLADLQRVSLDSLSVTCIDCQSIH